MRAFNVIDILLIAVGKCAVLPKKSRPDDYYQLYQGYAGAVESRQLPMHIALNYDSLMLRSG